MPEKNFGGGPENFQGIQPFSETGEGVFDVEKNHAGIPCVKSPGPKIGPDFSDAKIEKETNKEKLEKIKEVILEIDVDLLSPANTYKLLAKELKNRDLFGDEFKADINYYFNQKLVYLYNKENLKSEYAEMTEEARKKKTEAAFAGAKSLHNIIEKLEKIEENGGNDEKIKEYWNSRKTFYLNLKEKETEYLLNKEEMLLDSLQNAQKYGALAEKIARDLIRDSSVYIREMIDRDESLRNLYPDDLSINIKEASIKDDVYSSIDFYLEVRLKDEVKYFPVQVKCGNINTRYGDDEETKEYIMNNLVRVVEDEDKFNCGENSCFYEKKITDKLNRFVEKALINNRYEKGLFIILPRGKEMMRENGDINQKVKEIFFEQFSKKILNLNFN